CKRSDFALTVTEESRTDIAGVRRLDQVAAIARVEGVLVEPGRRVGMNYRDVRVAQIAQAPSHDQRRKDREDRYECGGDRRGSNPAAQHGIAHSRGPTPQPHIPWEHC